MRQGRQGEMFIGWFLILLSVAVWVGSASFEAGTGMFKTLSPAFYPRIVAGMIAFCALLILIQYYRGSIAGGAAVWGNRRKVFLCFAVMFLQVFTFEELGFFPSAFMSLLLLLIILRAKLLKSILITSGFILFVYIFFVWFLQLQLPMEFLPTLFAGS